MSENDRQRYVAYRSQSEEVKIRFFGGPLDGSSIMTDEIPTTTKFVHQVGDRCYLYRYVQISPSEFSARFDSFEIPTDP